RLVVATMQASDDNAAKRRYVGAAFVVWILFLPVILAAGAVLVWAAPTITQAPPELQAPVRLGVALLVGGLLFANLASLPESVLRGMNLGYKRMGLQAALEIVGGALTAGAIAAGLGIAGAAGSQHVLAAGGAIPGIGGVIGRRQYDKAAGLRYELLAVTWLFATAVGGTILLWNRSFLGLWVGSENYAGPVIDLLIVLVMTQTTIIR